MTLLKYCLLSTLLISIRPCVHAQSVTSYPTELVAIDSSHIIFEKQQYNFNLGEDFPTVIIQNIYYHKQAKKYLVFGFIDDVNYNGNVYYKVSIDIYRGGEIIYSTSTSKNGVFAFSLSKEDKARFKTDLYIDMYIK